MCDSFSPVRIPNKATTCSAYSVMDYVDSVMEEGTLDSKVQPQRELKRPGTADLIQRIQSSQGTVQRVVSLAEEGRSIR